MKHQEQQLGIWWHWKGCVYDFSVAVLDAEKVNSVMEKIFLVSKKLTLRSDEYY